jgi:hypothetical protein
MEQRSDMHRWVHLPQPMKIYAVCNSSTANWDYQRAFVGTLVGVTGPAWPVADRSTRRQVHVCEVSTIRRDTVQDGVCPP